MLIVNVTRAATLPCAILILCGGPDFAVPQVLTPKSRIAKTNPFPAQIIAPIVAVAPDGNAFTVEIPPQLKSAQTNRLEIKITDKTWVRFSAVNTGGARLTEGYVAQIWFENNSSNIASLVELSGHEQFKVLADVTGRVLKAGEKHMTIGTPAIPARGKGLNARPAIPATSFDITVPDEAVVSFYNVGSDGAKITEGYHATVILEDGSKDTAASVRFAGDAEFARKIKITGSPTVVGRTVEVAPNGKEITLELAAASKLDPPQRTVVKLNDQTQVVYLNVPRGGAKPTVGYTAQVWPGKSETDPASQIRFFAPAKGQAPDVIGWIREVALDGKSIVVVRTRPFISDTPAEVRVALTGRTKAIYNGVPMNHATPRVGMEAQVWLQETSNATNGTAARILFGRSRER